MIPGAEGVAAAAAIGALIFCALVGSFIAGCLVAYTALCASDWTGRRRLAFGIPGVLVALSLAGIWAWSLWPPPSLQFTFDLRRPSPVEAVAWRPDSAQQYHQVRCRCTLSLERGKDEVTKIALDYLIFGRSADRIDHVAGTASGYGLEEAYEEGRRLVRQFGLDRAELDAWRRRLLENARWKWPYQRQRRVEGALVSLRIRGSRPAEKDFRIQISVDWD